MDVDAPHQAVPHGDAGAARPVHANGVHLVEIGHCVLVFRELAYPLKRGDVAVHRIDALENDQLRAARGYARQQLLQVPEIVVAPYLPRAAGGTHTLRSLNCG
jgi:hypothetical protein